METIEELRHELEGLKKRVTRLEFLRGGSLGTRKQPVGRCEQRLHSLVNASKLLALEHGVRLEFSGKETAFQILVSKGYLPEIPHFFTRVRSKKDGALICLPLED